MAFLFETPLMSIQSQHLICMGYLCMATGNCNELR